MHTTAPDAHDSYTFTAAANDEVTLPARTTHTLWYGGPSQGEFGYHVRRMDTGGWSGGKRFDLEVMEKFDSGVG